MLFFAAFGVYRSENYSRSNKKADWSACVLLHIVVVFGINLFDIQNWSFYAIRSGKHERVTIPMFVKILNSSLIF